MGALDFKEIPPAQGGSELSDTFELFGRDFLELLELRIVSSPSRGVDAGRDLVVIEERIGAVSTSTLRWLVSCKHFAHSGKSVRPVDEPDIVERVRTHGCHGFLGLYSTLPSSGLNTRLEGLATETFELKVFDREKIEHKLLSSRAGHLLARRFFPVSYEKWARENPGTANVRIEAQGITCDVCGRDLLGGEVDGIVVTQFRYFDDYGRSEVVLVRTVCKGNCDDFGRNRSASLSESWEDIADMRIPTVFFVRLVGTLRSALSGHLRFSPEALARYHTMLVALFPHVARELTAKEHERVSGLISIPSYLGGIGE